MIVTHTAHNNWTVMWTGSGDKPPVVCLQEGTGCWKVPFGFQLFDYLT